MPNSNKKDTNIAVPPQSLENEKAVLACVMLDKEGIYKVIDTLRSRDFYQKKHKTIFEAIMTLYEKQEPIDLITVKNKLTEKKQLKEIGGAKYLAEIVNSPATITNIEHYSKIVIKTSTLRRLITAGSKIQEMGFKEEDDLEKTLDYAEKAVFDVSQGAAGQDFTPVKDALVDAFNRIDLITKNKGQLRGVPTGFKDIDKRLGGFRKQALIILAARPSVGKTSFSLDIIRNAAVKNKTPVAFFSLEMAEEELVDKLLCAEAGINMWKMQTGNLTSDGSGDDDFTKIGEAMGKLDEAPIFINDSALMTVMQMRAQARRLKAEGELGLVVVDYLQLMDGSSQSDSRVEVVSQISRELKVMAKELDVPVLALSQLNRSVEQRPDKTPKLADLRESGSIEQDADVVMFLKREVFANDEDRELTTAATLIIAKHRAGPTGEIELYFNPERASFSDVENQRTEEF